MTALEQLGAFVAAGGRGGAPSRTLALRVTDSVCAWLAGRCTEEGAALVALRSAAPRDEPADRVALYSALARLSEIDDIHLASGTTPGGVIIPAALTLAAAHDLPGQVLAEAITVGYEAMVRLGHAIDGASILYRGIWTTYFAAPFGTAAVAARALGLDAKQAAHALGIALVRASPGVGHQSGPSISRWWALGQAAGEGVRAALAAKSGFTADLRILEGEFFRAVYALKPDASALTARLGEASVLDTVAFKPWCAARQTMTAAQALIELMEAGVSADAITAVDAFVPPPYRKMIDHGVVAGDRASHLTSLPYQLALAALERDASFDAQQNPEKISSACAAFMEKVKVHADEGLLVHYPKAWPARVAVKAVGAVREKLATHVPGDPERPFGEREVVAKFRRFFGASDPARERAVGDFASRLPGVLRGDPPASELLANVERMAEMMSG
jgi:2-methylcitrate dehydratase PrpD